MKNTTRTLVQFLTLTATATAFADTLAVGQINKLDLAPVVVVTQALPTLKVGSVANKDNAVLAGSINNGVSVNLPFVAASATLGTAVVGPGFLNVKAGNENSVTLGPITVGQRLPTAQLGTGANKTSLFDIRINNGIGLTLPFVSIDVPLPFISTKAPVVAATKGKEIKK